MCDDIFHWRPQITPMSSHTLNFMDEVIRYLIYTIALLLIFIFLLDNNYLGED